MKAIVFDFDGTILETEMPDYISWKEVYTEHGADLPMKEWAQHIGTQGGFNPIEQLEQSIGKTVDRETLQKKRRERHHELILQQTVLPGVREILEEARSSGLKIGLASSSSRQWVETHLRRLELWEYFECVRTSDDVVKVKPDPELYIQVLDCLGVEPHEAMAIEDSANGSKAAKSAGMHCAVVPTEATGHLDFSHVDCRLETLHHVGLAALFNAIQRGE